MAEEKRNESDSVSPPPTNMSSSDQSPPPSTIATTPPDIVQDRTELLTRARLFLNSPQILYQDATAKRNFLLDKGLNEPEIERLLRELVRASWVLNREESC